MYNKDDIVYILENDQVVRKAKVAGRQDDLYIVQLIGSCGAIYLPESRLFESAEAAEENRQKTKLNSANVRNDFISNRPDPFDRWINSQKF
mgnify:FL=1